MARIVCFVENLDQPVRITAQSSVGVDNYEAAIEIPASRFVTGHDYVFIFSGHFGDGQGASSSGYAEVMPYLGSYPLGTFLTGQQSAAFIYGGQADAPRLPYFAIYRNASWPAGGKISIRGTTRNAFSPSCSFEMQASIMVWDLTELGAAGPAIPVLWAASAPAVRLPVAPAEMQVAAQTMPSSGDWLLFYYSCISPTGGSSGANTNRAIHRWQFEGNWINNAKIELGRPQAFGDVIGHRCCNGKFVKASFNISTTGLVEALAQDSTNVGPAQQSQHIESHLFGVKMDTRLFAESTAAGANAPNFWSRVFPFDSQELLLQSTPTYFYSNIVMGQVNNPIDPVNGSGPGAAMLTMEGEPIAGPLRYITPPGFLATGTRVPMHRIGKHGHGGGKHYVSFRGGGTVTPTATPFNADDAQIVMLNGIVDIIPPADVLEGPGPVEVFVPKREAPVSVAALPLLPIEPSWSKPIDRELQMRELRIPRGYVIASPKFSGAIERVAMGWLNRSTADIDAVIAFLDGLKTTEAAFRWRPKWEAVDQAYAIEEFHPEEENPLQRGVRSLNCVALKLVWVMP